MKGLWLISFFAFASSGTMLAQKQDDTTVFRQFELIAAKNTGSNIGSVQINLPLTQTNSLAEALSQYSALFVKFYSPTSLATTSMRGMGAQHTAVLWNGVNLQSSMNGVMDFNLLPSFFIDQAVIETGANASTSAFGAIAGAIHLSNKMAKEKAVFAEVQQGSFNYRSYALGFSQSYKKWNFRTRALHKSSDNDFEYVNYFMPGKPLEKLAHSKFVQYGAMQEISFRASDKHLLYLNGWHQQTYRQLPPAMGASALHERQNDFSTRLVLQHDFRMNSGKSLVSKLAYLDEQLNYYIDNLPPAYSHAKTAVAESEFRMKLNNSFDFSASLNYTQQYAKTDGYVPGVSRQLLSLWTRLEWKSLNEKLRLSLANRQLLADGKMAPASPDFGFVYKALKVLHVKGNAAYSFRMPSFNDLYWSGGGNASLKPEQGKKAELSAELKLKDFKLSVTGFYHQVNNWIMWLPEPNSGAWKATNARQVESRGVEVASEYGRVFFNHHAINLFGRYQYVESINTQVYAEDATALNKQLFYTPLHTGFAQLRYSFKGLQFNFGAVYTGSRFTTSDNSKNYILPSYITMNAGLGYLFIFRKHQSSLHFNVNNLGNVTYQVIENRPMPLRNYQVTLKININYDKN